MININKIISVLQENYKNWDAPIITFIANRGASPFEILVSTILSLRTKDEVTAKAAKRIFTVANRVETVVKLNTQEIEKLIYPVGFYHTKAKQLLQISKIIIEQYNGNVPDKMEQLLQLPGVGRKTANLIIAEGFKKPAMCVDTHVHRISNRIGYVKTKMPDKTEFALRKKLPRKHWIVYNELFVAFGQVICRPISPWCSRCPIVQMCQKIGVNKHR